MYEKLEECPSCKHPKFSNFIICDDFSISGESFALVQCERCELIFTNPRPDEEHIGSFYKSEDYISHTNKANNLTNFLYKLVRNVTLRQKHQLIKSHNNGKRLLDFGCGSGVFLKYMHGKAYDAEGYETDSNTRQLAESYSGCPIHNDLNSLRKTDKYDVITAWHVIEHVHDLIETLTTLRKGLTPEGVLFVALPNIESFDAQYYRKYWAGYDVPRHLYHFSQKSFSYLAKKCKLNLIKTYPMRFDAYYVSLLSEKYKTGKSRMLPAFKTGYLSNQKAKVSGQYSSLIYVLKK